MASVLRLRDPRTGNWVEVPALKGTSAYESAQLGGYTGTEEQFYEDLAYLPEYVENLIPITHKRGTIVSEKSVEGLGINVISYIEPVQAGSGDPSPDNVRPISGWNSVSAYGTGKNLLGGKTLAESIKAFSPSTITIDENAGTVTFHAGNAGSNRLFNIKNSASRYTIILKGKNGAYTNSNIAFYYTDGTYSIINFESVNTVSTIVAYSTPGKQVLSVGTILYGGATTLYYDECGLFEGILTKEDFEAYKGKTLTAALPETVYGGTVDWTAGQVTVTHKKEVIRSMNIRYTTVGEGFNGGAVNLTDMKENSRANGLCETLKSVSSPAGAANNCIVFGANNQTLYAVISSSLAGTTKDEFNAYLAENPLTVVYPLAEPYTIQLTPQQLSTIDGTNNVWSDCGDTKAIFNLTPVPFSRTDSGSFYHVVDGQVEWINPPLIIGQEYRTTERWQGKPVYTKLLNFGTMPNATNKTVDAGIQYIDSPISITVTAISGTQCFVLPSSYTQETKVLFSKNIVEIETTVDRSDYTAYALLKYTKL